MSQVKEHERFKLQWMLDHGYTLEDLMKELDKLRKESPNIDLSMIFDHWQFDVGFGSEIWPCYDEWLEIESQQQEIGDELAIPIGDKKVVAYVHDWYDDLPKEMYVVIKDGNGRETQTICMVREHYHFDDKVRECVRDNSMVDCKVWGDTWSEDYTDEFVIGVYEEEWE